MNWTVFWLAMTAIGTLAMAGTTARVIFQNRRHHRDEFRPLCVLEPYYAMDDPRLRNRLLRKTTGGAISTIEPGNFLSIHCVLKNVGTGPAVNLRLGIRFRDMNNYELPKGLGAIAANESRGDNDHPILVPVRLSDHFNQTDFDAAEGKPWELWLWYEDLFGEQFFTKHVKDPNEPWVLCGKGRKET